ncbi:MAG: RidA family protein [Planctomycetota bacterium]
MHKIRLSSGSSFESDVGYSRAIVVGDRVFLAGTTGFDYRDMTIADDIDTQTRQCLDNIRAALEAVGAGLPDVVRMTLMLRDADEFHKTWPALKAAFGDTRPTSTMFETRLSDDRMKIEIEVDAILAAGALECRDVTLS